MKDDSAAAFAKKAFADRPDVVEGYLNLSVSMLKDGMLRYMSLYDRGDIWSDLDVSCEKPIKEWAPTEFKDKAALVVG